MNTDNFQPLILINKRIKLHQNNERDGKGTYIYDYEDRYEGG